MGTRECEQLKEEVHKLHLKLESLKKTHATELDFLREESELKERELRATLTKFQTEAKQREELKNEKIAHLNDEVNCVREENDSLVVQVDKLRTQVEVMRHAKSTGPHGASNYSDYEGLKECQRTLKAQLEEKDSIVTKQTDLIRGLNDEVAAGRNAVVRLSEEVEGKESVVRELQGRVKEVEAMREEDVALLQHEVIGLKERLAKFEGGAAPGQAGGGAAGSSAGGTSRGNSLFSEVDERRVKVEDELTRLRSIVKKLTEDNRELKLEVERGDSHNANISAQLEIITKSEGEIAREIKKLKAETLHMFDSYRDRFEFLRSEYTRKLQQYKSSSGECSSVGSELESLRTERDQLLMYKFECDRENNELKRELKYNKHLRVSAEANLKIARTKHDQTGGAPKGSYSDSTLANPSNLTQPCDVVNNNSAQESANECKQQ